MSQTESKKKMGLTADLIRHGASILQESCPHCGSVQIKFRGKTYCTDEDDLESLSNAEPGQEPASQKVENRPQVQPATPASESLRKLMEIKLNEVSKQLDSTTNIEEQAKLLDLISKYIETLDKLRRSSST